MKLVSSDSAFKDYDALLDSSLFPGVIGLLIITLLSTRFSTIGFFPSSVGNVV